MALCLRLGIPIFSSLEAGSLLCVCHQPKTELHFESHLDSKQPDYLTDINEQYQEIHCLSNDHNPEHNEEKTSKKLPVPLIDPDNQIVKPSTKPKIIMSKTTSS